MSRIVGWAVILVLANVVADVVVGSPMMVIPQLLDRFDTDEAAWLTTSALLAGAVWSPLLARAADIHGRRKVLVFALALACGGALICVAATSLWVFLMGRFLQGAAFAVVFLSVALVLNVCSSRVATVMVGIVTSASSVVGIVEPVVMKPIIDDFGPRSVFVVAAVLAAVSALGVRVLVPESSVRSRARLDVVGALLLGGGLSAVLASVSVGADAGQLSLEMVWLVVAGGVALAAWCFRSSRSSDPIIDLRVVSRRLVLTLVALLLAAGSFRSMLQLMGVIAYVPAERGLGYGLGSGEAVAALFAVANLGIAVGGVGAGWLALRVGSEFVLLGGVAVGAVATVAMTVGVSALPVALVCGALMGVAAGAIGAAGYTVAMKSAAEDSQATVAGLVSVVVAVGSVLVTIVGAEVLEATRIPDAVVSGAPVSTATGVQVYVSAAGVLLALAALPATVLARGRGARAAS
ncbi:MFS transporter [Mycobacterium sp. PSTR-4-N]|uniref:MFS transporter n=1 Tax=Mycobacterium sp. PSTR-4-N TaxID=2917745 RepID=UPI001F156035|nr:MFS transporter [Mycobacterium sp. PSTR-4-N]MCG7596188.1 MFS transporter [Mycobacterium sp. PSTR-4-N]